jgi:alkylated DNA repair protein (DNA oxidative demethylase)
MLFAETETTEFAPGAMLLRGAVGGDDEGLLAEIPRLAGVSPFRRVVTPSGKSMSVEITSCGAVGWSSDRRGYRYEPKDPVTGDTWPEMPALFRELASRAAARAGYANYVPDTCLINKYSVGSKMGMHQDRDEQDFSQPIVSVSLGLPITFKFGGATRSGKTAKVQLIHGDVVVFGGPARLAFHGVGTLRKGEHPLTGAARYNLTFRVAC